MTSRPPLFLYLLTNRKEGATTTTQIGCTSDVAERTRIHNSPVPVPGSDRRARQAAGHWKPLLIIVLPVGVHGRAITERWKASARKIHGRFQYGIENVARHFGLPYFVDVEELLADRRIADALPKLVAEIVASVRRDTTLAEQVARDALSPTFPLRTALSHDAKFSVRGARPEPPRATKRARTSPIKAPTIVPPALEYKNMAALLQSALDGAASSS